MPVASVRSGVKVLSPVPNEQPQRPSQANASVSKCCRRWVNRRGVSFDVKSTPAMKMCVHESLSLIMSLNVSQELVMKLYAARPMAGLCTGLSF